MGEYTTIRVTGETYERLKEIKYKLQAEAKKEVDFNAVIEYLLNIAGVV